MNKLPKMVKNLDGDSALKVRVTKDRDAVIDMRAIFGVVDVEDHADDCLTVLITGWGSVRTQHTLESLEGILYPVDKEY